MSPARSLPVLLPAIPGQRWSCHSCGRCCRELVGHLTAEERARIDAFGWRERLGVTPYVFAAGGWALNKQRDGTCVFLDAQNRCRIHAEQGEPAKPLACRIFPFSVRAVEKGWQASFRFDCPSAAASQGASIESHRPWLASLIRELDHAPPGDHQLPHLSRGVRATQREGEDILERFAGWLAREDVHWNQRLIGAARAVTLLAGAKFKTVRGERLGELLDLVFAALPSDAQPGTAPATPRQRGLLRQLAFAHAEHVTLAEIRTGWLAGWRKRWQQLRRARRFRLARGAVPSMSAVNASPPSGRESIPVTFASVEQVRGARDHAPAVGNLLRRYLIGRLNERSVFGDGYYHWPVFAGLGAWILSTAAAGWLARWHAARCGRVELSFEDAACGIGLVDRGATRLPALGTLAERARLAYLLQDDGLARLLVAYAMTSEGPTAKGTDAP